MTSKPAPALVGLVLTIRFGNFKHEPVASGWNHGPFEITILIFKNQERRPERTRAFAPSARGLCPGGRPGRGGIRP